MPQLLQKLLFSLYRRRLCPSEKRLDHVEPCGLLCSYHLFDNVFACTGKISKAEENCTLRLICTAQVQHSAVAPILATSNRSRYSGLAKSQACSSPFFIICNINPHWSSDPHCVEEHHPEPPLHRQHHFRPHIVGLKPSVIKPNSVDKLLLLSQYR